ncbi:MAG: Glycogen synthase [candidate division TA06 bacterium ADurb.Bin417]|uniref:Glycogen synthase n=1 Tax=candidate division TA06 bacterium ADurb.Bin417 TaxID=1852828 RepID=A0A1V5M9X0_UNCT6|nr:MAG: Glycogen synthase [candidate division TA06 bacterium ADurb.Bin417]
MLLRAILARVPRVLTVYDYWFFCPRETLIRPSGEKCSDYHGPACLDCLKTPPRYRLMTRLRRPVFNFFLRRFQAIIFLSEASRRLGLDYGLEKDRTLVIPQVYDFRAPETLPGAEFGEYLVYVGWVQERKGLHVLLAALAAAGPQLPESLKLLVVGETEKVDPAYVARVHRLVERLKLSGRVRFLGRRPQPETAGLVSRARAVVIPEQWENMSPVVLVEAMHYGRPVIASRIGGIPEFIEDGRNGLLFEPGDAAGLARKLVEIIRDPGRAATLGRNAAADAGRIWNTELNLERLINLYRSHAHA